VPSQGLNQVGDRALAAIVNPQTPENSTTHHKAKQPMKLSFSYADSLTTAATAD
jgi:hypothetical protein